METLRRASAAVFFPAITVWREAFARLHLGSAAALAVALFAVLLVMTVAYGRLAREEFAPR